MSAFLSFVGGAAKQFVSSVEQSEQDAKEMAKSSFNGLYKRYEENAEANRELTNKMKAEKQYIETVWSGATPEQVNELLANPVALEAIKKTKNPSSVDLNNYIKVIKGNESKSTGAERAAVLPELVEQVKTQLRPKASSPIGGFIRDVGKERMESDMEKYAKGMGVSLEELRSTEKAKRPTGSATFDMGVLQEAPDSVEDIAKAAKVKRFQIGQKLGKDSEQYKQADAAVKEVESEIVKTDKKIDDRRDRLELEREDNKDNPAIVAALTKEIDGLNKTIQARREATSTKREREGEGGGANTYAKARARMEDYMNTDMVMNRGLEWRKYVEDKVVFDPATQRNITIPGKKANLTPEQDKEYFEGMTKARMQGLRDLGLVTADGKPVNREVQDLMVSFGLTRPTQPAPAATPAPATPAPATPAAIPTAQPAPAKVVSRATVQAQADKNKVPYEVAAKEAEKQGYTIR